MFVKLTAIGRLTKDPEVKTINGKNGQVSVADFTVAVDVGFGDNKRTEYIDCVAWRGLADTIGKYCTKGMMVHVEGTPNTDKYEIEKEGVKFNARSTRWTVEDVTFLSKGKGAEGADNAQGGVDAPF